MRIVFLGSGEFAVPSLHAVGGRHSLPLVITQPDRPAGRKGRLRPTPVAVAAEKAGLEVRKCDDVNDYDVVHRVNEIHPEVICVVDFGQFVRAPMRQAAQMDTINLHGSLLPGLRGAAPVNWAIIRGHEKAGVTTISLTDEMDAGGIYLQRKVDVPDDETAEGLSRRLAELGAEALVGTVDLLATGGILPRPQNHDKATFAPRLKKSDGAIDFTAPAEQVKNLIHGTWPWPGGQAVLHRSEGEPLRVIFARARAVAGGHELSPGEIDSDMLVGTGRGRLEIMELKPAGRKLMSWRDFVNGYRPRPGDKFTAP